MVVVIIVISIIIAGIVHSSKMNEKYKELEGKVFTDFGISDWTSVPYIDDYINVKSRQALEKYDELKYFKDVYMEIAISKIGFSRREFERMIEYCQSNKLEIILTKKY